MSNPGTAVTYLLIDGENIDSTLGQQILDHRPNPDERPRWERLRQFAEETWGQAVTALFFLNASSGALPTPFIRALQSMDYRPIPLSGGPGQKVVDIGIQRTLDAIGKRRGDVLLASHDGDFLPHIGRLLRDDDRRVGVVGFPEFFNAGFDHLVGDGLERFDLELDAGCFTSVLPRVRILPIDTFDPEPFL
ncbi:NYN domain-containing protein [Nucisporomicrobium flavum]|jgi:putative heme uptake system protein|uniref:NYN domain-containing protein n=1 Tax=Nucisporomicrobium flavum TaxID=2785915 RepID=UPI0018F41A9C|nr:NYN domain-containing protein [Nucisporomicrobium flavum]